jgi:YebC/PmpR family DNA-binding regulatory protein
MAGHSKWANIKHRKGREDAKKGKIYTKIGREIMVAVKQGGADPETNSKLKDAISKAKSANMPNDNIQRSIKKASGDVDMANFEDIVYEGYGPSGVAIIVEALTDNRNRTAGDLRHFFDKYGGNLGQTGCVSFMFDKKGIINIERTDNTDEDEIMMEALEAGAEDIGSYDEYFEIITEPNDFSKVRDAMEKDEYKFLSSGIEMIPKTFTKLDTEEDIKLMEKLIDHLEDHDDVKNIYYNLEQ